MGTWASRVILLGSTSKKYYSGVALRLGCRIPRVGVKLGDSGWMVPKGCE